MKDLKQIAHVFLKSEDDFQELSKTIESFEALVVEHSEVNLNEESNKEDLYFENGKALGTTWAAMCIRDVLRTKYFIQGVLLAIEKVRKSKKKCVEILYAGCGPFATLVLPAIGKFSSDEVQFTLLEVNKNSINNVKRMMKNLGVESYIKKIENVDATLFEIHSKDQYDIVVSETMQHALIKEQQVPIVINLMKQLNKDVLLIPQEISLELGLIHQGELFNISKKNNRKSIKELGSFFKLNSQTIDALKSVSKDNKGLIDYPKRTFKIEKSKLKEFQSVSVFTKIIVYENLKLALNQSGLTVPKQLINLDAHKDDLNIQIGYQVSKSPDVKFSLVY